MHYLRKIDELLDSSRSFIGSLLAQHHRLDVSGHIIEHNDLLLEELRFGRCFAIFCVLPPLCKLNEIHLLMHLVSIKLLY